MLLGNMVEGICVLGVEHDLTLLSSVLDMCRNVRSDLLILIDTDLLYQPVLEIVCNRMELCIMTVALT